MLCRSGGQQTYRGSIFGLVNLLRPESQARIGGETYTKSRSENRVYLILVLPTSRNPTSLALGCLFEELRH